MRLLSASYLVLLSCGRDDGPQGNEPAPPTDTDLAVLAGPEIVNGGPLAPLSRAVRITLSEPARLRVSATDGSESLTWSSPAAATEHLLPLVGTHADGEWVATLTLLPDGGGEISAGELAFTTGSLPDPQPTIDVLRSEPSRMQPGLTLVPLYAGEGNSYLSLFDETGRIVWIYGPAPEKFTEVRLVDDGEALLTMQDHDLVKVDWMGETLGLWSSTLSTQGGIPVDCPEFHHELFVSSRGTFVTFTKASVLFDPFHLSEFDALDLGPAMISTDHILEIDPADGAIVATWKTEDLFDRARIGYESLTSSEFGLNWVHLNSGQEDVVNNRWIVTGRHQDAVFAVQQGDGTVDWILGNHDNWSAEFVPKLLEPQGKPFQWPFHQHAVHYDPATSKVLMFDNGNYRASPFTGEPKDKDKDSYSRIVEYTVDETARTVTQNWEHQVSDQLFSPAMGDADWLPNGNVLSDYAFVQWQNGVKNTDLGRGLYALRLAEFDPASGDVVWEVDVWAAQGDDPDAWQAYRAERIDRPYAE